MTSDLPDYTRYVQISVSFPSPNIPNPKPYEGSVTAAGTPVTLDVNADLGKNSGDGFITCDGPGNLLVTLSKDGTTFTSNITVKVSEVLDLSGLNIDTIKIDATVNATAYRCLVV